MVNVCLSGLTMPSKSQLSTPPPPPSPELAHRKEQTNISSFTYTQESDLNSNLSVLGAK